jgi:hypothetical protein
MCKNTDLLHAKVFHPDYIQLHNFVGTAMGLGLLTTRTQLSLSARE